MVSFHAMEEMISRIFSCCHTEHVECVSYNFLHVIIPAAPAVRTAMSVPGGPYPFVNPHNIAR